MAVNYKYELVGVLGFPVAENPTCVMQEAAFAELGLQWRYLTIEVKPDALADAMRGVRALGMQGVNLTIPHKVAVMDLLDDIAPDAKLIGAVNTVRSEGGRLIGENTDGKGFLRGLLDSGVDPHGKRIVVLGAGGAARAITFELALSRAAELILVNRGEARGRTLVADLQARTATNARLQSWNAPVAIGPDVDVLVNATSIGLYPDIDAIPAVDLRSARTDLLVCDVIPNPPDTRLVRSARALGLNTLTGLPMLVYQGAIGFQMWTGRPAPVAAMKHALEQAFGLTA